PWGLLQLGWARLDPDAGAGRIALEILALVAWNDVHFWINHRLLHTRLLRRFHLPHHRSVVTTPFSTYSFHPVEALMLGNVILLPMVLHDFSLDRKSTRLNSSHVKISYAVFCLKKKNERPTPKSL